MPDPSHAISPSTNPALSIPKSPTPSSRFAYIDGIRALAALFVVLCHAWYEPTNGYYKTRLFNHLGLSYGPIAVAVFIVVSGFCLTLPLAKRDGDLGSVLEFFRRRARRILPPYYACIILSCIFILTLANKPTGTVWDICLPLNGTTFLQHVLLIHNLVPAGSGGSINYPLWSIAVEAQIYLLFPLVAILLQKRGWKVTMWGLVALGLAAQVALYRIAPDTRVWYLGCFGFGVAAAWQSVRGKTTLLWTKMGLWLGGLTLLALVLGGRNGYGTLKPIFDLLIGGAAALIMGGCYADREQKSGITRLLSLRPLERVGIFSYSLYLVHAPLLHLHYLILTRLFHSPKPETMFLFLLLTLPLIVAEAYLFFLAFERPFLSKKTRVTDKAA